MGLDSGLVTGRTLYAGGKANQEQKRVSAPTSFIAFLRTHLRKLVPSRGAPKAANRPTMPTVHTTAAPLFTQTADSANPVLSASPAVITQLPRQGGTDELTMASVAVGLATTSALVYPPTQVLCLPMLLYLGIEPAQTAYHTWRTERRVTLALAETTTLAFCIARQAYLAGALSYWCYTLWQGWHATHQLEVTAPTAGWQSPPWAWVQQAGGACKTPVAELHSGDIIVVHTGEMVPAAGVIMDGVAWVRPPSDEQQASPRPVRRQVGQRVETATIVQVGCIIITVA